MIIRKGKDNLASARLKDVSQLVLCGNVGVSAQTIHLLSEAGVPIVHLSSGHWFHAITYGIGLRNAYDRAAQFAAAAQPNRCLSFAKAVVSAKGSNQRTMLRRNGAVTDRTLREMQELIKSTSRVQSVDQLLGLEGSLAAHYFRHFDGMLRPRDFDAVWDFASRNRRPPKDPVLCQNSAQPASTKELRLSKSGKTLAREQVTRWPPTLDCGSTHWWIGCVSFIIISVGTLGSSGGTVRRSGLLISLHRCPPP